MDDSQFGKPAAYKLIKLLYGGPDPELPIGNFVLDIGLSLPNWASADRLGLCGLNMASLMAQDVIA